MIVRRQGAPGGLAHAGRDFDPCRRHEGRGDHESAIESRPGPGTINLDFTFLMLVEDAAVLNLS